MPDSAADHDSLRAALHGVRALLLDMDGVIVLKGEAVAGSVGALAELDRRAFPYLMLTNTSLVSREKLAQWGRRRGFATPADRFQTALSASAEMVRREYGDRPVYVITSDDARIEFEGINVVDGPAADAAPSEVAAVVLGDSPHEITKANLDRAFRLVRGGAALIGMHRNAWWLTRKGPTLDAGAFLVGLEYATERKARIVGKPSPESFRQGFERLAVEAHERGEPRLFRREVAMVGDDIYTDVGAAQRVGLRGIFVRTGKHGDVELATAGARARGAIRPHGIAASIAEVVAALG
jgi:HAD superfamily hydrolase (TIGR01458 family)